MKADAKIFKGIEYIVVTDLPKTQQERLLSTINHDLFIKIMIDGKVVTKCLQYKDYSIWYDQTASVPAPTVSVERNATEQIQIKADFALNKI